MAIPTSACARLADFRSLSVYRVLHYLLSQLDMGNDIRIRVIDISDGLGMSRPQVSRAIAELKDKGVILDRVPFGFRLHPDYGWRGGPSGKVVKRDGGGLELTS